MNKEKVVTCIVYKEDLIKLARQMAKGERFRDRLRMVIKKYLDDDKDGK